MTRSREEAFLYSLSAYTAASLLSTLLILLASLAAMRFFFAGLRLALGAPKVYLIKPLLFDSCGFAVAAALTGVFQYFAVSLFKFCGAGRGALASAVLFMSVFCGLFFWRGAFYTSLGGYAYSGLAVTLAALLGGLEAVFQDRSENPWPPSTAAYFG